MKIHFIFNPKSGPRRKNARLLPLLREFVAKQGAGAELHITAGPGHATELARQAVAAGCERVVAVGGDGTMNEVAQALIHSPVALALVPGGSGNGLARHLGIPLAPRAALELAMNPAARLATIDTGLANRRLFCNVMGLGFDAEVSARFGRGTRRGLSGYVAAVFGALGGRRSEPCRIEVGTEREALDVLLIAVANSDQYGSDAIIAPGAKVDDGLLNLVAIRPIGLIGASVLATRLFRGTFDKSSRVRHLRGERFTIQRSAPGVIHTDGECHDEGATVEILVQAGSLKIVVPM